MSVKNSRWVKLILIVCLIIFIVSVIITFVVFSGKKDGKIAVIYQDGVIIYKIDLEKVVDPYQIRVDGKDGCYNIIDVRPGEIGITEASCPDKICVNMDYISDGLIPITCLPNKLVIRIEDGEQNESDIAVY